VNSKQAPQRTASIVAIHWIGNSTIRSLESVQTDERSLIELTIDN